MYFKLNKQFMFIIAIFVIVISIFAVININKKKELVIEESKKISINSEKKENVENIEKNENDVKDNNTEKNQGFIEILSQNDFEKYIMNSEGKKVVLFGDDWCVFCKKMKPDLERLGKEGYTIYDIHLSKVDPEIAQKYYIRNLPELAILENGEKKTKAIGYMPYKAIKGWIDRNLKNN